MLQLDALFGRLPRQRRTGLFSATQTEAVEALARAGLRNPVRVNVAVTAAVGGGGGFGGGAAVPEAVQCTPATLSIQHLVCEAEEKLPQLVAFLQVRARWLCWMTAGGLGGQEYADRRAKCMLLQLVAILSQLVAILSQLSQLVAIAEGSAGAQHAMCCCWHVGP